MAKVRNDSFDIAKGFGILFVVLAHCISPVMEGHHFLHWLYITIYSLVLPLFFITSGYFSKKLVLKPMSKFELIKQRAARLMIPYCVWAVIYLPMKFVMAEHVRFSSEYKWYTFFLGNNPDGQLWFLYVMFVASVIMILFTSEKNITAFAVVFMVISLFAPGIPNELRFTSIALNFSLYQVGFFFLGAFIALKCDFEKVSKNKIAIIVSSILLLSYFVVLWIADKKIWYLETIAATCGIYVCFYISSLLSKTVLNKPLSFLGKKSMEIYIMHAPILVASRIVFSKLISNDYLYVVLSVVTAIGVSIALSWVVNKIKIARLLIFGSN